MLTQPSVAITWAVGATQTFTIRCFASSAHFHCPFVPDVPAGHGRHSIWFGWAACPARKPSTGRRSRKARAVTQSTQVRSGFGAYPASQLMHLRQKNTCQMHSHRTHQVSRLVQSLVSSSHMKTYRCGDEYRSNTAGSASLRHRKPLRQAPHRDCKTNRLPRRKNICLVGKHHILRQMGKVETHCSEPCQRDMARSCRRLLTPNLERHQSTLHPSRICSHR